ncbi:MAG: peptidoglycan-binding domain-containing protein [Phycicoccus sp.]
MPSARRERGRSARTLGALSASVIAFPLVGGSAGAASVPVPRPSRPLPSALDVAPPYQKGTRCLTEAQPGAVAFAKLLNSTYGTRTYGILRRCAAEHGEGRALDWMINAKDPKQLALADTLTRWLSAPDAQGRPGAMARRFGINYIIWNRKQWRAYAPERGWAPYFGVSPHTDHIHISFTWDGAYARTSWWTGKAVTSPLTGPTATPLTVPVTMPPPPAAAPAPLLTSSGYPHLRKGAGGAEVKLAQKAVGVTQDGRFGPLTAAAVGRWQGANGVRATTEADNATWARMVALRSVPARPHALERHARTVLRRGARGDAVAVLQQAVGGLRVDGSYGPATEARVKAYQGSKRLAATGVVDQATWYALMNRMTPPPPSGRPASPPPAGSARPPAATHPLAKYAHLTLRRHARGPAVTALQKALGRLATDGSYGPATEARVREYQTSKRLRATGVTDRAVWNALMGKGAGAGGGSSAGSAGSAATSAAAARTTAFTSLKTTVLRRGSSGTAVRTVQQALGGLAVDGRLGPRTEAALLAFQRSAKLPGTGVVDRRTWDALERRTHPLLPHWGTVLKRGARGAGVQALQRALRIAADGSFGPATEAAVRSVQQQARIAQTGVVATLTWRAVEARMPR